MVCPPKENLFSSLYLSLRFPETIIIIFSGGPLPRTIFISKQVESGGKKGVEIIITGMSEAHRYSAFANNNRQLYTPRGENKGRVKKGERAPEDAKPHTYFLLAHFHYHDHHRPRQDPSLAWWVELCCSSYMPFLPQFFL